MIITGNRKACPRDFAGGAEPISMPSEPGQLLAGRKRLGDAEWPGPTRQLERPSRHLGLNQKFPVRAHRGE